MSLQQIGLAGTTFLPEVSNDQVPLTVSSYSLTAPVLTVTTTAAHGLDVGDTVVIKNSATAYTETAWTVVTVPSTTTFTVNVGTTAVPVNSTDTIIPVTYLPAGTYYGLLSTNATVEYNPDNTGAPQNAGSGITPVTDPTWRTAIAASGSGFFWSDGNAVRLRCGGTAGTSYYSQVE